MARGKKKGEFCNCILFSNLFTLGPQNMKLSMDDVKVQFKNLMSWLNEENRAWCTCSTHVTTVLSSSVKLHYFFSFFVFCLSCIPVVITAIVGNTTILIALHMETSLSLMFHYLGKVTSSAEITTTQLKKKKNVYIKKRNF